MQIPPGFAFKHPRPDVDTTAGDAMRVGRPSWRKASVQSAPLDDSRFVLTGRMSGKKIARRNKNDGGARIKIARASAVHKFIAERH